MKKFLIVFILIIGSILVCSCSKSITVTFDPNNGTETPVAVTADSGSIEPMKIPVKEGYFFGGWWTEKEGGKQWLFNEYKTYDGLILYAHWLDTMLTVIYDSNLPQGESLSTLEEERQHLAHGSKVIRPQEPELDENNYFFKGWSKTAVSYTPWVFSTDTVLEDTVIYAFWERFAVVSFDLGFIGLEEIDGDKSLLYDKRARAGSKIKVTSDLKIKDKEYLFGGWYVDDNFSLLWSENNTIYVDIILFAKWDEAVRLTFDINAPQGADVEWEHSTEFIFKKDTILGYNWSYFDTDFAWFINRSLIPYDKNYLYAVNTWYYQNSEGEEEVFSDSVKLSEDTEVYAKWREANFYKFNGVYHELFHPLTTVESNPDKIYLNLGELPIIDPNDRSYFVGWFYKSNPSEQYFGEKVAPHTEFISKSFNVTSETFFEIRQEENQYYAILKPAFNSSHLVIPTYIYHSDGANSDYIYNYKIDLTEFPNIDTIVLSYNVLYNINYYIQFTYPEDRKINFYGQQATYSNIIYDNHIYYASKINVEEYVGLPYHSTKEELPPTRYYYNVYASNSVIQDSLFMPVKTLPIINISNNSKFPMIIEARFLDYYHYNMEDNILFCESNDLDTVNDYIANGRFSGSVAYDMHYLDYAKENYLIADNKLIYYMSMPSDIEIINNKLIVDLRKSEFSTISRINTNSIIINTAKEGYNFDGEVHVYIPSQVTLIENRAIKHAPNLSIYFMGACPQMVFRAKNAEDDYADDGTVASFNISKNAPHSNYYYNIITYYIKEQYQDSYADWIGKINWTNKMHIYTSNV